LLVIRHGKAGDRANWHGDDRLRPHAGLSDVAFGERLKKGETLVVDGDGGVTRRIKIQI
jgi:hypothetical protein